MTTRTEMTPDHCRVAAMISRMDYRLPPGDVTAAVMERIQTKRPASATFRGPSWLRTLLHWLVTPRPLRVAPAVPLGAVAGVIFVLFFLGLNEVQEPGADLTAIAGNAEQRELPAASMVVEDGEGGPSLVVFTIRAENARNVALIGSFNNWRDQGFEMRPAANNEDLWTIAVPLEQGRYEYAFLLNGERILADPQALLFKDDGFGSRNSVIIVEDHEQSHLYS